MGNIISTELLKIKRYSVVKAGLVMMSLSVLMSCFYSTASTNKVWDFQYFIQQVIISNCTLFFPIIITLVAVYIISRETTDDTLKSILTAINEQISNFAQSYPANSITASIEAPLLINRYRFVSCSCFSCFCKKA